jgi:hypothetical protein
MSIHKAQGINLANNSAIPNRLSKFDHIKTNVLRAAFFGNILLSWCWAPGWNNLNDLAVQNVSKENINANNFSFTTPIWNSPKSVDWKILSGAKDKSWKAITAWPKTTPQKWSIKVSWSQLIYSPNLGVSWDDVFVISILDAFNGDTYAQKEVEVKVTWINTLNANAVIQWIVDWKKFQTSLVPYWSVKSEYKSEGRLDWYTIGQWTKISDWKHRFELAVSVNNTNELIEKVTTDFEIDTIPEFDLKVVDNFSSFNLNLPRPNSQMIFVNSNWEATISLDNLNIPPENIWMILKFDDPTMSENVSSWKIAFDNKKGWMASINMKILDWNTIKPHSWLLNIKIQNWEPWSEQDITVSYTVINK